MDSNENDNEKAQQNSTEKIGEQQEKPNNSGGVEKETLETSKKPIKFHHQKVIFKSLNGAKDGAEEEEAFIIKNDDEQIAEDKANSPRTQSQQKSPSPLADVVIVTTKSVSATVDDVNWLSFISFTWIFPWMWRAYKCSRQKDEGRGQFFVADPTNTAQWTCSIFDSANVNLKRLEHLWAEELNNSRTIGRPPSLFRALLRFLRFRLALACFVFLFCIVFGFIGPTCLVRGLISFVEKPPSSNGADGLKIDYWIGFYLAAAILLVEISRVLAYGATWAISYRTAIRTRGAVLALLYKTLLNAKSMRDKSSAEIVNMFANDGQRLFDAVTFAPLVLIGPFVLIGGLIYLLRVIGPISLLAVFIFLLFDFIQAFLGITLVKCRNLTIAQTEKRMALIGEIIRCIKCIKLNAWEKLFYKKVCDVRNNEKRYLRIAGYTQSLMIAFGAIVPSVATICMVLAIVLSGNDLKASDAFSAITVFFVMLFGVRMIPYGMRYLSEAVQSLRKISTLLQYEQYEAEYCVPKTSNLAIQMQNCTFKWDTATPPMEEKTTKNVEKKKAENGATRNGNGKFLASKITTEEQIALNNHIVESENANDGPNDKISTEEFTLRDVNLSVEKGELVGICGVIGCGKSALLNAITGHLIGEEGSLCISGNIAFCPQQPTILNSTVRDNILFGQSMNAQRYYKAIQCAQLSKDLEQFPENERSKVSACKLSGGQRSRISVARALYSNREIYLFDDIFSSIDKPVAERIFAQGIKEMLATKTRLVVTCDPDFLAQCSKVIFMDRGQILAVETHTYLLQNFEPYRTFFASFVRHNDGGQQIGNAAGQTKNGGARSPSDLAVRASSETPVESNEDEEKEEDLGLKPVGKEIYMEYIWAGGGKLICLIVIAAFVLNVGSNIFATFWLSKWMRDVHGENHETEHHLNGTRQSNLSANSNSMADPSTGLSYYAGIYAFNMFVLFLSGLFKAMVFVKLTLTASTQLHNRMVKRVLYGVSSFFHQTPAGRILNRFSKDIDEIDVKLPFSAEALLQGMITCLGFLLVIIWVFPLFLLPCIPLFLLFLFFFVCFRAGIRSLKRVENVTRSPLFEHLTASLDALPTIHAFGQTQRFVEQLKNRLDENSGALFLYHSAMRWQAVWLDLLVVGVTFAVSLFIVILTGRISPSEAGMAIAFALQMSGIFQFAVRSQTELEAKLTAVERVSHYYKTIEIEPDSDDNNENKQKEEDFPSTGHLEFENVVLRYHPNATPALNNVTFSVQNAEKIGIVGRTGSGKTSICNALFRLYPLEAGRILVDGRDISTMNLPQLRRSMAIISQEATLFAGTLRFNIDPEGIGGGDHKIWECLQQIGLGESVNLFTDKLDFMVEQGGRNLSAGQRQLVCLVRALLRDTKIVLLDEATANIDVQTDSILQRAVGQLFASRTVLLITHRLGNVANVDRVMEMQDGKIKSFESIDQDNSLAEKMPIKTEEEKEVKKEEKEREVSKEVEQNGQEE